MGKKKGFDIIAEAHERANNNMNPYYWFNRITHFQLTSWRVQTLIFSPIFFVMTTILGYLGYTTLNEQAINQGTTFILVLFDFSDSATTARFVGFLFFVFYWIVFGLGTIQSIILRIVTPPTPKPEIKREKKKKHPKRPKNYK